MLPWKRQTLECFECNHKHHKTRYERVRVPKSHFTLHFVSPRLALRPHPMEERKRALSKSPTKETAERDPKRLALSSGARAASHEPPHHDSRNADADDDDNDGDVVSSGFRGDWGGGEEERYRSTLDHPPTEPPPHTKSKADDPIEAFQKDAILREMLVYKSRLARETTTTQQLRARQTEYEKQISLVHRHWLQVSASVNRGMWGVRPPYALLV